MRLAVITTLPVGMEHQVAVLLGMVQEPEDTPLGPVVGDGSRAPVQNDSCIRDGQQVWARVVDLDGTPVLQQSHSKIICRKEKHTHTDHEERN